MLWRTSLLPLVVFFGQVLTENIEPKIIDDSYEAVSAVNRVSRQERIVSGWEAFPGKHPHHASLRMVNGSGTVTTCGGSLVSRQWVITAAHCTAAARFVIVVRLGVTNLTTPQHIMESHEWYTHPTFVHETPPRVMQYNDIGIVKLPRPVIYTRLLQRIRIQPSAEAFRDYRNEIMYTSGHGRLWLRDPESEVLHWVYQRAAANDACRIEYPSVVIENSICAIFYNDSLQRPCMGDGGGPLVHVDPDGVPILVGVASFRSSNGCNIGWYTSFIRPGPFHSWFTEVTGIDFENLVEDDDDTFTTLPPEEEEGEDSTIIPEGEDTEEDEATIESNESEEEIDEQGSGDDSNDSSDSESDEDPFASLKKLEIKVKVKVKLKKQYKVKKIHIKKKHLARKNPHNIALEPILL